LSKRNTIYFYISTLNSISFEQNFTALHQAQEVNSMNFNHPSHRVMTVFCLTLMFFLIAQTLGFAAKKKDKKKDYVIMS
jgi:hypothetical protein